MPHLHIQKQPIIARLHSFLYYIVHIQYIHRTIMIRRLFLPMGQDEIHVMITFSKQAMPQLAYCAGCCCIVLLLCCCHAFAAVVKLASFQLNSLLRLKPGIFKRKLPAKDVERSKTFKATYLPFPVGITILEEIFDQKNKCSA